MSAIAALPCLSEIEAIGATEREHDLPDVVGVFDSGIGGLSVLRELRAKLPSTHLHYVADAAYAPYGERSDDYVADRSVRIARHLVDRGATVIVVACNTATAAAVHTLRSTWPTLAVVGVEPGIKPAVLATRNGRIGVLATPGTLASARFRALMERQAGQAHIVLQPCPGLATLIESGDFESDAIRQAVRTFSEPLRAADVDTVVLGCTHYAFIRSAIEQAMGRDVEIVDTAEAVSRRAVQLHATLAPKPGSRSTGRGTVVLETTGDTQAIEAIMESLSPDDFTVRHTAID